MFGIQLRNSFDPAGPDHAPSLPGSAAGPSSPSMLPNPVKSHVIAARGLQFTTLFIEIWMRIAYTDYAGQAGGSRETAMLPAHTYYLRRENMGKIVKFLLQAVLCLILLGMVIGLMEQVGGVLIVIVVIVGVFAVIGKKSSDKSSQPNLETNQEPKKPIATPVPEPVKKAADDKMEKLHVDMEE